jgi:GntR family transcriptional regulator
MATVDGEQPEPYSGNQPQYQLIANDLRSRIDRRDLPPGAQVPTEKELARTYGCSRNTVRQALQALAHEGLISAGRARAGRSVRRRERFVLTHRIDDELGAARLRGPDSFGDQAHRLGKEPSQELHIAIIPADSEYAGRLEVPVGEELVVRREIRYLDRVASHLSASYYPLALVKGTPLVERNEIVPSVLPLLTALGHRQVRLVDEIVSRMPDPDESRILSIGVGVPVIEHFRTAWSVERPIRVTRTVLPGDRQQLRYELPG